MDLTTWFRVGQIVRASRVPSRGFAGDGTTSTWQIIEGQDGENDNMVAALHIQEFTARHPEPPPFLPELAFSLVDDCHVPTTNTPSCQSPPNGWGTFSLVVRNGTDDAPEQTLSIGDSLTHAGYILHHAGNRQLPGHSDMEPDGQCVLEAHFELGLTIARPL